MNLLLYFTLKAYLTLKVRKIFTFMMLFVYMAAPLHLMDNPLTGYKM